MKEFVREEAPDVPDVLALPDGQSEPNEHRQADDVEDEVCLGPAVLSKWMRRL
jgi:hypothetical protein